MTGVQTCALPIFKVIAVNDAPVATGSNVTGTEDTPKTLHWSDFGVTDVDSAITSLGIVLTQLPAHGSLQLNGVNITSTGQTISHADIDSGKLTFVPVANASGSDYATIGFQPSDGTSLLGTQATVTINVTAVADAPTLVVAPAATGDENTAISLVIKSTLVDTDGSETLSTIVSGIPVGAVLTDGTHSSGQAATVDISGWDLTALRVTPAANDGTDFALTITATSKETSTGLTASSSATINVTVNAITLIDGHAGTDTALNGTTNSDIIVGDVSGTQIVVGQNYNIAIMLDSSGSMNDTLATAKTALTTLFTDLQSKVGGNSGVVNIFLADFDTTVHEYVSVNLADKNALHQLQTVIDSISNGGGTNYEDVFKETTQWFASDMAKNNANAQNLTFFITDGQPTYYLVPGDVANTYLVSDKDPVSGKPIFEDLATAITQYQAHPGTAVTLSVGSGTSAESLTLISATGEVSTWSKDNHNVWYSNTIGVLHSTDSAGNLIYEAIAGTGYSTDSTTTTDSMASYTALAKVSVVEDRKSVV